MMIRVDEPGTKERRAQVRRMKKHPGSEVMGNRLIHAAEEGDIEVLGRLVVTGVDLNHIDPDTLRGALHQAVAAEQYTAARWLLQQGADVNLHDPEMAGDTPLIDAVRLGYSEIVELLLAHGADPDIQGWMGMSARMHAMRRQDDAGKRMLLAMERRSSKLADSANQVRPKRSPRRAR